MLIKNYKDIFKAALLPIYDEQEIDSFFYLTLESIHDMKRIDLALNPEMEMDASQASRWQRVLDELKKQKPIQYILGETEFYGLRFIVNEATLIPRPETEELVDLIISNNKTQNSIRILDIGTGSGCIAISLAKNMLSSKVFAIDVSEDALATAKKNAEINKVEVTFEQKNILEAVDLDSSFDVIVSNPPYVRNLEKAEIKPNVLKYEPHLALFVDDNDALLFYRNISQLALKNLNPNGKLYFEINQYLGKETVELLQALGFSDVELKKDIYGNDRMISAAL